MLAIGLTGGIASGKTTISNLFSALEVPVIDTDIVSRAQLEINQPGYEQLVKKLGKSILLENNGIDRRQLRSLVFSDNALKVWLESLLHPLIYTSVQKQIERYSNANIDYVLIVVPLLFESNFTTLIDHVLVVDCPRERQAQRLVARDGIDTSLAESMLDHQWSNDARLERADYVIHNSGCEDLDEQVQKLHKQFLIIADEQ